MSDETKIAVVKAKGAFSMAKLKQVKGLSENSPLRRMNASGDLRLTVDGNQFISKKGSKKLQTFMDGKKPSKFLDVVIHSVSPVIQQQAALKYDPKNPKYEPLGCWSNDGNRPDDNCWGKQAQHCDTCKFTGGKEAMDEASGKMAGCGLTRQAVVSLYSPTQEPEHYFLINFNWSSNSTKYAGEDMEENLYCLINYLELLKDNDVDTHRLITRLHVDDYSDPKNNCKLLFEPVDVLKDDAPNIVAHDKWIEKFKEQEKDFHDLSKVSQRKPQDASEALPGTGVESEEEAEPKKETAAAKAKREKAEATKAEMEEKKKKAALARKKKKAAAEAAAAEAARLAAEAEEEEDDDEIDLDDLDDEETDDDLKEESDDDFGDLDDLLVD